jgi:hypothetical protein
MATDALPYEPECERCALLQREEKAAHAAYDLSAEVDARIHARRHLGADHGVVSVVRA